MGENSLCVHEIVTNPFYTSKFCPLPYMHLNVGFDPFWTHFVSRPFNSYKTVHFVLMYKEI